MIIKRYTETEWYIPHYATEENVETMLKAYDSYQKGNYRNVRPEDWSHLYDSCIIWKHYDAESITMPQHPYGKDLDAWLKHIWSHTEYYVGTDKSGFTYFVFKK